LRGHLRRARNKAHAAAARIDEQLPRLARILDGEGACRSNLGARIVMLREASLSLGYQLADECGPLAQVRPVEHRAGDRQQRHDHAGEDPTLAVEAKHFGLPAGALDRTNARLDELA